MLNKNLLKTLPSNLFSNLSHLKTLSLASNQLTAFPENLNALRNLDVLDLSDNKIRALPDSIGQLQAMELNFNANQVATLPESLAQCPRLKVLRLEENCLPLDAIPTSYLKNSQISLLALDGNMFAMREFHDKDGYDQVLCLVTQICYISIHVQHFFYTINCQFLNCETQNLFGTIWPQSCVQVFPKSSFSPTSCNIMQQCCMLPRL